MKQLEKLSISCINGRLSCITGILSRLLAFMVIMTVTGSSYLYADKSEAGDDDVEYYRVVGAVIDVWGNPLPGALVRSGQGMEAVTDADGTFSIFLSPGDTKLTASYPGLHSKKMNVKKQPVVFELYEEGSRDVPGRVRGR